MNDKQESVNRAYKNSNTSKGMRNKYKRRVFLGVPIPLVAARQIAKQMDEFQGRKVPLSNWHLTLHFLGYLEETQLTILHRDLQTLPWIAPYQINFDHIGAFPKSNKAHTLWIGSHEGSIQSTYLVQIISEVLLNISLVPDTRPYLPHVTIQRFTHSQNIKKQLEHFVFQPVCVTVNRVILYESILNEGAPKYVELFVYPLNDL